MTRKCRQNAGRAAHPTSLDEKPALTPAQLRAHRRASARAAKRRLRVVSLILVANAAVAGARLLPDLRLGLVRRPGRRPGRLAGRLPADGQARARRAAERPDPGRAGVRAAEGPDRGDRPRRRPAAPATSPRRSTPTAGTRSPCPCRPTSASRSRPARVSTIDLDVDRRLELGPQRVRQPSSPARPRPPSGPPPRSSERRASGA